MDITGFIYGFLLTAQILLLEVQFSIQGKLKNQFSKKFTKFMDHRFIILCEVNIHAGSLPSSLYCLQVTNWKHGKIMEPASQNGTH